jgi:hypothetical protein
MRTLLSLKSLVRIVCLSALVVACSKESGSAKPEPAAAPSAETHGHAPANVKPGSHEDWCEEHGVPESQCTRCNPKLSAAFKATGDWCEEHGLPESQCTKCNPGLKIVRPPKAN